MEDCKTFYRVRTICSNCSHSRQEVLVPLGMEAAERLWGVRCKNCGCKTLQRNENFEATQEKLPRLTDLESEGLFSERFGGKYGRKPPF